MKKISKLLPAPQMEEDFISCVSYAPLCSLANEAFLGENNLFPYPLFQHLLQIIRWIHPQLLSDIATLGGNIGFRLIEQDTDFTQLLILQDEIADFSFRET